MKTPHNYEEKERRRMKTPHEDAKMTEQRSCQGMKMTESKNAPHQWKEGTRSPVEPRGVDATQIYPRLDPGNEAPWK
jgi:hypothetical protein